MMIHWVPPPATLLLQEGLPMASPGVVPGLDTLGEVGGLVCPSTVGSWGLFGFPLAPSLGLGVSPTVWAWCLRVHDREWALYTSGKLASQLISPGVWRALRPLRLPNGHPKIGPIAVLPALGPRERPC